MLRCTPDAAGNIPPRPILLKIEKEAAKLHEHLLVWRCRADHAHLAVGFARPRPADSHPHHTWHKGTSGESLRQKLNQIIWSLEEEETVTLTDVITGLKRPLAATR